MEGLYPDAQYSGFTVKVWDIEGGGWRGYIWVGGVDGRTVLSDQRRHLPHRGSHFETLVIYKLSIRKFTTQKDIY